MPRCLVSLGSNLGDRQAIFDDAFQSLSALARPGTLGTSSRYETRPVGGPSEQEAFLNAIVSFETSAEPPELLASLQLVEQSSNRERTERWAARSLDLDLLLYDDRILRTDRLRVPHPRMTFRPFVLQPAAEMVGDWIHPECQQSLAALLAQLAEGSDEVHLIGQESAAIEEAIAERSDPPFEITHATDREPAPALAGAVPKLTIDTRGAPWPLPPSGPRLALADSPREHWREEVLAALECVWPTTI